MTKNRTRPWRRWMLILAAFAMLAGACGGEVSDEPEAAESDSESASTSDAATEEDPEPADEPADEVDEPAEEAGETEEPSDEVGPNIYDDPRGGIFTDFQAGFDRGDHPFTQLDSFCLPTEPASDRIDTDTGIGADTITIVHLRTRLEDVAELGFGVPVGDVADQYETLARVINEQCGGIRGRQLVIETIELPAFGATIETDRNAACLRATEDLGAAAVINSTGFQGAATLCIVEENETIFLAATGQADEFYERSDGRLVSFGTTNDEGLAFAARDLVNTGELAPGDIVGVAAMDTPGQPESVELGLVEPLREAGIEVVFDVLACNGGNVCSGGLVDSVSNMREAGITHFFNVMGVLTAPGYFDEMVNQGFEPGDVQFLVGEFNAQGTEVVASQIVNNPASGELYNGAMVVSFRDTGAYRADGYAPVQFEQMCNDTYNENTTTDNFHRWEDTNITSAFGATVSVCTGLRILARAFYDAGENPSREDVEQALQNLGPVDTNGMTPASIQPGKGQIPDAIQTGVFEYPCTQNLPYTRSDGQTICITGQSDWREAPR